MMIASTIVIYIVIGAAAALWVHFGNELFRRARTALTPKEKA